MFMIRLWVRSSEHPKPYYLVEVDDAPHALRCTTSWALAGNKLQTYATERSANLAFKGLSDRKSWLEFRQWDDSDAAIEGEALTGRKYQGREFKVASYEIQLLDVEQNRIAFRFSGPR